MTEEVSAPARGSNDRWRRFWPGTFAGRLTILILAAIVLIQAASALLFYLLGPDEGERELAVAARASQLATIVTLMDEAEGADRARLQQALGGRTLALVLHQTRPALVDSAVAGDGLASALRERLATAAPGPFEVVVDGIGRGRHGPRHEPPLMPGWHRLVVVAALSDGTWLELITPRHQMPRWRPFRLLFWLAIGLGLLLLGRLAARRFARPLELFAEAADRLGVDVSAPPLPVTGSAELRRASAAFNRMQARIRRLVDDRTQMLAAIAHDLRTALTRLRLRVELIDDPVQQAKAVNDLEAMRLMLDETLAFAKGEALEEGPVVTDLAALLQTLVDDLSDAGHEVAYDGPDRLVFELRPVAARRALANLIDNAVRYGGSAEVSLRRLPAGVEVQIADRGPGIPPDQREHVFKPFVRLEGSRARSTGGTGLGLALTRSIVRRHGGDITLEDRPGGGLLVRVSLPDRR
jgi:signal transduction histidine kinase